MELKACVSVKGKQPQPIAGGWRDYHDRQATPTLEMVMLSRPRQRIEVHVSLERGEPFARADRLPIGAGVDHPRQSWCCDGFPKEVLAKARAEAGRVELPVSVVVDDDVEWLESWEHELGGASPHDLHPC